MATRRIVDFQLYDMDGIAITGTGGKCFVAQAGDTLKRVIYDADGVVATNPVAFSSGHLHFEVLKSVTSVDLYIQAPGGQFRKIKGVVPGDRNTVAIDTMRLLHHYLIPWAAADYTAATETDTGFTVPTRGGVSPMGVGVEVTAIDATEDIDVGTLSTDSGDADGFIDSAPVGVVGFIKATLLASGDTMGALLSVLDSANAGDDAPEADFTMSGKAITITLSAGSDTGKGIVVLPVILGGILALA